MLVSLSIAKAAPTAFAPASSSACAEIFTAPCAVMSAPWVTRTVLSAISTLTETAAATPTPLESLLPSEEVELWPLLALPCAEGIAVEPDAPLVLLLPLTCLSAWPSAPDLPPLFC